MTYMTFLIEQNETDWEAVQQTQQPNAIQLNGTCTKRYPSEEQIPNALLFLPVRVSPLQKLTKRKNTGLRAEDEDEDEETAKSFQ